MESGINKFPSAELNIVASDQEGFDHSYSNGESPSLSEAKRKQKEFRKKILGTLNIFGQSTNVNPTSEENINGGSSPFRLKRLFWTTPEVETESESKLGIHYSANFKEIYKEGRKLGEGCMGLVKKVRKIADGLEYAVKIVKTSDCETIENIKKEFINIVKLDHPNIVKVYEIYINKSEGRIYTIMELINSGEMFDVIKNHGSYSEEVASKIFKQILLAIQYMHSKGCCHRDLKPNNILCNEDGSEVKITDFNVSKFDEGRKNQCKYGFSLQKIKMWTYTGTIAFCAPEILQEVEYNESVDMWSAGVVLYTMLCGYQPFSAEYVEDLIEKIITNKYEFQADPWDKISTTVKDLIQRCLTKNPKERITPTDALMHPWIAHKNANTNILPHVVFENLRKNITRLSRKRMDRLPELLGMIRSKSGVGVNREEMAKETTNEDPGKEDEEEEENQYGEGDRRAISYIEELRNASFFQFMTKTPNQKIKNVKSQEVVFGKIKEEEKQ